MDRKQIFLLGGHDLEMEAIKSILGKTGHEYSDRNLKWDNALLSAYSRELYAYPDCDIYGIELRADVLPPANYHLIDNHNENHSAKSSL